MTWDCPSLHSVKHATRPTKFYSRTGLVWAQTHNVFSSHYPQQKSESIQNTRTPRVRLNLLLVFTGYLINLSTFSKHVPLTPNKKLVNQNTKVQLVHQVLYVTDPTDSTPGFLSWLTSIYYRSCQSYCMTRKGHRQWGGWVGNRVRVVPS